MTKNQDGSQKSNPSYQDCIEPAAPPESPLKAALEKNKIIRGVNNTSREFDD